MNKIFDEATRAVLRIRSKAWPWRLLDISVGYSSNEQHVLQIRGIESYDTFVTLGRHLPLRCAPGLGCYFSARLHLTEKWSIHFERLFLTRETLAQSQPVPPSLLPLRAGTPPWRSPSPWLGPLSRWWRCTCTFPRCVGSRVWSLEVCPGDTNKKSHGQLRFKTRYLDVSIDTICILRKYLFPLI